MGERTYTIDPKELDGIRPDDLINAASKQAQLDEYKIGKFKDNLDKTKFSQDSRVVVNGPHESPEELFKQFEAIKTKKADQAAAKEGYGSAEIKRRMQKDNEGLRQAA